MWALAFHSALVARADGHASSAFLRLGAAHPALTALAHDATILCQPGPYAALASLPILVALLRRRWVLAAALVLIIPGAVISAELLKALISQLRPAPPVPGLAAATGSWPSGHATASMIVVLAGVLASPRRWRPACAGLGSLGALAIMFSVLILGWHLPSDVLGGVLLAALWACLAVAGVSIVEARTRPVHGVSLVLRSGRGTLPSLPVTAAALALPLAAVILWRGGWVFTYAADHRSFVGAVLAVSGLGALVPAGLTAALNGSARAPRAVRPCRSRPG
ncbi:MAG TPA: phosphatase PAP2 family protein [Solirubrobacteraceae bacterium]|nr:phosphatase PAP2 family protein [Solirubrobacteraceae bacterium]